MPLTLASVVVDAADVETEGAFWHRLLGGSLTRTPAHHFVQAPGLPVVVVQSAPGHTSPDWPDGVPQQIHLDFAVEDLAAADHAATAAGATRLRPAEGVPRKAAPAAGCTPAPRATPSACARSETVTRPRSPSPSPRPRTSATGSSSGSVPRACRRSAVPRDRISGFCQGHPCCRAGAAAGTMDA